MLQKVLVTGGLGYIGSHTTVELLTAGYDVIIVDNLSNSSISVLDRIYQITKKRPIFYDIDICNYNELNKVFIDHKIDSVIHFAAFKAVGESVEKPLAYYKNNVSGSIVLFELMQQHNVATVVFSSSATVYGNSSQMPLAENSPLHATSPYGQTKLIVEQILQDIWRSSKNSNAIGIKNIAILRYFNPVGAHQSGLIGENPNGIPNNLMPYICQVATGKREYLNIFGHDYPTSDGTGVRDYIHVVDLAMGHLQAINYLNKQKAELDHTVNSEPLIVNLGTGVGYSVLDVVKAFETVSQKHIKYKFVPRRDGDVAVCYAKTELAHSKLGWNSKLTLNDMCLDAWRFQQSVSN